MSVKNIISVSAFFMLISLVLIPGDVKATHIVGGDMTYRCLGNDLYELTLTIRRDCENGAEDAPFDDPAYIGVFDIFGSLQLHLGNMGRYEIPFMGEDTITNSIVYDCSALGTPVCVHEAVYRDTIFLPFNKIGYRLAYQRCCRNSILVNIEDPLETGATYHVSLPINVLSECNSQPVFNSWPDVYACVNEPIDFDLSATDPDGDQLVYSLCTPAQGATSDNPRPFTPSNPPYPTVVWQNPYNLTNMIGGSPPLTIDPATGQLSGMPNQVGTYLIGVCVEEFRNGELYSTVRRDFEVNVRVCADPIELSCEIDGAGNCNGNLDIAFTNTSGQSADMYRWLVINSQGDTILIETADQFDFSFPDYGIYSIVLEGTRLIDGCTARKIENLVLGNPEVEADFEAAYVSCDSSNTIRFDALTIDPTGSSVPVSWQWMIDGQDAGNTASILFDPSTQDEWFVELFVEFSSGCSAEVARLVRAEDLLPEVSFEYSLLSCDDASYTIEFTSTYSPEYLDPESLDWTVTSGGITENYSGESIIITIDSDQLEVSLSANFGNGCTDTYEEEINIDDLLPAVSVRYRVVECIDEDSVIVILESVYDSSLFETDALTWTINGVQYDSETVELLVSVNDSLVVDLVTLLDNGCFSSFSESISGDQLFPILDLNYGFDDCPEEGEAVSIDIEAEVTTIATGFEIDSIALLINGDLYNTDFVTIDAMGGDSLDLALFVLFTNGCTASLDDLITLGGSAAKADFEAGYADCDSLNLIILQDISGQISGNSDPVEWNWTINNLPAGNTETIVYDTEGADMIEVTLSVLFSDGCSADTTKIIDTGSLFPEVDFDFNLLACVTGGYELELTSQYLPSIYNPESINWIISDDSGTQMLEGETINVTVSGDSLEVVLQIDFENGCSDSYSEIIYPGELIPDLELQYSILECIGEDSIFVLIESGLDSNSVDIDSLVWTVNGVVQAGSSVEIILFNGDTLDTELTVYFENGCMANISESITADQLIPQLELDYGLDDCPGEGEAVTVDIGFDVITIANGLDIDSIAFIINDVLYNTQIVTLDIQGGDSLDIEISVLFTNGCTATLEDMIQLGGSAAQADFEAGFENCDSLNLIRLEDISGQIPGNSDPVSWAWIIDGNAAGNTETIVYDAGEAESLDVYLSVTFADGCQADTMRQINVEDLFPEVGFDYTVSACTSNGYELVLTSQYQPEIYNPDSIVWTITDEIGTQVYTGETVIVSVEGDSIEINLQIDFDNNCSDSIDDIIYPDDSIPVIGINYTVIECLEGDSISLLIEPGLMSDDSLSIDSVAWVINGASFDSETVSVQVSGSDSLMVTLTVYFENGCVSEYTETISTELLYPPLDIDFAFEDCPSLGDTSLIELVVISGGITNGFEIDSLVWTIEGENYFNDSLSLEVIGGDTLDVSLEVFYNNGCMTSLEEDIFIGLEVELEILEEIICENDEITVYLSDTTGLDVDSYTWIVNGTEQLPDSSSVSFILDEDSETVVLTAILSNGCIASYEQSFDRTDYLPELSPEIRIDSCYGDSANVFIDYDFPTSIAFDSILINGIEYDSLPVLISLPSDSMATISYFVEYQNGCSGSDETVFIPSELLPDPDFDTALIDCTDDGILIIISDNTDYNGGYEIEWTITQGDSTLTSNETVIDSFFVSDTIVTIIQTLFLDNGCIVSDTMDFSQSDLFPDIELPEIEFEATLVECEDDSVEVTFTDITEDPECLMIMERYWIINGDSCVGNPVTKTLPLEGEIPFELWIIFSNGDTLSTATDTIDSNDIFDPSDLIDTTGIEVASMNPGFCSDSINLFVVNPDSSVLYEWASDSEFTDILATGPVLDTVAWPGFNGVIYIQTNGFAGPCEYGLDSIAVEFMDIDLDIDSSYTVCAGDTFNFMIPVDGSDPSLEYIWKDSTGMFVISGDSTSNPLIGIPEQDAQDFFLILCTSNAAGCSATDTINFTISEPDTLLPFSYAVDSCGSLTVQFDESPNMLGDAALWDFGDGSTGTGSTTSHSYQDTGTYLVTLMDSSAICPSEPITIELFIGDLMVNIIGPDTLYYETGDTAVVITAETNGVPDSIQWCTEEGVVIGSGPEIEFDPMMDTVLVIAKIQDGFGCTDRDSILLIPEMDPQDCLDSIRIDGPLSNTVCDGEEFVLCVILEDECDPGEFSYLWDPEECIIEGQGTPKVIGLATESKTIMVLVTHIASGIDSIYSFDLNVSLPNPEVMVPEINIDEDNNPFVCLGQSIILSVEPADPNCTYTWSDGSTGSTIEIFPEEDFSIWVECIDTFGCVGVSDTLDISVVPPQCDESDVFIPNAFSPNGDNVNDVLFVRSKFIDDMELVIVNRWGQEVFRSTDQSVGWDGSFNGEFLAPDAFSYTLSVLCIDGQSYVTTGNVSIIK